jgi:selenocysteine lyase/cysteine desulfurase
MVWIRAESLKVQNLLCPLQQSCRHLGTTSWNNEQQTTTATAHNQRQTMTREPKHLMVEHSGSADSGEDGWQSDTPSRVVYLNNAGQAPLEDDVKQAGIKAIQQNALMPANDDQKRVRELFSGMIEAESPFDIAIMPSTAFAITLAARNIQKTSSKKAGRIVVLQDQFNSAIYPWQEICKESHCAITLDIVPHPEPDCDWTKSILQRLDENTVATCLPPLHWSDGTLIDLIAIKSACLQFDITLIVDATQGKRLFTGPQKYYICSWH